MTRTTHCPRCQVPLNIPQSAGNKRLKCPKCGTRFYPDGTPAQQAPVNPPDGPSPSSSLYVSRRDPSDVYMPSSGGVFRGELDDVPLVDDDDDFPAKRPPSRTGSGTADVHALFDDEPAPRRPPSGAEARARARRCEECGSTIPVGMVLCPRCGVDSETGTQYDVEEMIEEVAPPVVEHEAPAGIILVGSLTLLASVVLAFLSFVRLEGIGAAAMGILCVFGAYASVHFLRGKSARPLLVAVALAAVVDVIGLIIIPVVHTTEGTGAPAPTVIEAPSGNNNSGDEDASAGQESGTDDQEMPKATPLGDQYKQSGAMTRITWGIILLLLDAGIFVYLMTAGVRDHFERLSARGPIFPTV